MAINKVVYGTETLVDLTDANVTAESLPRGITAYGKEGELLTGTEDFVKWSQATGYVGKNLMESYVSASGSVAFGITFTVNDDASVTANGTADSSSYPTFTLMRKEFLNEVISKYGKVILSGCPQGGGTSSYLIYTHSASKGYLYDYGSGVEIDTADIDDAVRIQVRLNYVANNLTFYPMLRYADIEDDTYEPYLPDNREIAESKAEKSLVDSMAQRCGYNYFPLETNNYYSHTAKGITGVIDKDAGVIRISGTLNEQSTYQYMLKKWNVEDLGIDVTSGKTYRLYDGLGGGNAGAYVILWMWDENSTNIQVARTQTTDRQAFIFKPETVAVTFVAEVPASKYNVPIDLTLHPMLYLDDYGEVPFQPYAMSNRELTEIANNLTGIENGNSYFTSEYGLTAHIRRCGNVVVGYLAQQLTAQRTSGQIIGTLTKYKPIADMPFTIYIPERQVVRKIVIHGNGDIKVIGEANIGDSLNTTFTYFTTDY